MTSQTVLITGLNSFVAVHTALWFLENGWKVKGTVRSDAKGKHVLGLPALEDHRNRISYIVVESLESGDFSQALEGVDAVRPTWATLGRGLTVGSACPRRFSFSLQRQNLERVWRAGYQGDKQCPRSGCKGCAGQKDLERC